MHVATLPGLPSVGVLIVKALANSFRRPSPSKGLPSRAVVVEDLAQDERRAADYARLTGFGVGDVVPATWLHVLTFPLQAHLMAQPDFPFPLAGIVHVTNDITMHRPVRVDERLRLRVEATDLASHRKGATFDLVGRIHVGDELVWEGRSNYLATGAKLDGDPPATERLTAPEVPASQRWRLPANLGRQYAKVSGDTNPIHLSPLTSRLFGFPRPIIHGMWTHSRALAAFGGQLPGAYRVRVQFTKPILLPNKVGFASDGNAFAVVGTDGKPRLVGELTPR